MFRKKKDKHSEIKRVHSVISDYFSTCRLSVSKKLRLAGRIRLANRWARNNPKKFVGAFFLSMLMVFALDFTTTAFMKGKEIDSNHRSVVEMDHTINGMRKIEANRESIKTFFGNIVEEGTELTHKLDSLQNIENKTHQDSLAMMATINRLNAINTILSYEY